uniref:Uncharacterized protein n=1 Tax=Arundo donax TaxID=35708 RepID=A0A0A9CFG8_ARUDO
MSSGYCLLKLVTFSFGKLQIPPTSHLKW